MRAMQARTTRIWVLVGCLAGGSGLTAPALAAPPRVAVAACDDATGTPLGQQAPAGLADALAARGYEVLGPAAYAAEAAKRGFDGKKASGLTAIRALSKALSLSGVVTCATAKVGPQFALGFFLFGADGAQLLARPLRLNASALPPTQADLAAAAMAAKLPAPPAALAPAEPEEPALAPLVAPEPAPGPAVKPAPGPAARPAPAPVGEEREFQRLVEDAEQGKAVVEERPLPEDDSGPPGEVEAPAPRRVAPASRARVAAPAREPEPAALAGATPDVRLALGASIHQREGLSPRVEADTYAGVRLEGRAFLGTCLSVPVLEDLGVGLLYDRTFGLGYSTPASPIEVRATEQRWQVELAYRLMFPEVPTGPAAMVRVGYGELEHAIDGDFPALPAAGYTFVFGALGLELWLLRDWLSARVAAGCLWSVWPDRRVAVEPGESGLGLLLEAGLDLSLLDGLNAGFAYEQIQVVFDDRLLGHTSDLFQVFLLRLGWQWR
jgi:hypothetical protein